jgi:hypothetical protein
VEFVRVVFAVTLVGCNFQPASSVAIDATQTRDATLVRDGALVHDAATHDSAIPDAPSVTKPDASSEAWPCGAQPPSPPSTVTDAPSGASLVMSSIELGSGGQLVVVAPAVTVDLTLTMDLHDSRCGECIDQLEVGWMQGTTGNRSGCAFDGDVPNPAGVEKPISKFPIETPTSTGQYDLRTNIGQNTSCDHDGADNWWAGEVPAASTTIVTICVASN